MDKKIEMILQEKFEKIDILLVKFASVEKQINCLKKNTKNEKLLSKVEAQILIDSKTQKELNKKTELKRQLTKNLKDVENLAKDKIDKQEQQNKIIPKKVNLKVSHNDKTKINHMGKKCPTKETKNICIKRLSQRQSEILTSLKSKSQESIKIELEQTNQVEPIHIKRPTNLKNEFISKSSMEIGVFYKSKSLKTETVQKLNNPKIVEVIFHEKVRRLSKSVSQKNVFKSDKMEESSINRKLNEHLSKISENEEQTISEKAELQKNNFNERKNKLDLNAPNNFLQLEKIINDDGPLSVLKSNLIFDCDCESITLTFNTGVTVLDNVSNIEDLDFLDVKDKMYIIEALDESLEDKVENPEEIETNMQNHEKVIICTFAFLPIAKSFNSTHIFLKIRAQQKIDELNRKIAMIDDTKNTFVKVN